MPRSDPKKLPPPQKLSPAKRAAAIEGVPPARAKKIAFACLFLLVTVAFVRAQQTGNQRPPFSIQLSIDKDYPLQEEMFRRNGYFRVDANITNVSGEEQTIIVWTQPGWSWVSDNPAVQPDTAALKNYPVTHVLQPGKVYSEGVGLWLSPRTQKPVTFRLGFFARPELPVSERPDAVPQDQLSWSNAVTLVP